MTVESATEDPRVVFRTCPLCEASCGLALTLSGDRVTRVEGDAEDVFSRGFICPKGALLGQLHEDPDRLRAPQVREGSEWRTVSWEEAFERVNEGLTRVMNEGGRDAVAVYLGNPTAHNLEGVLYAKPLLKSLRTRSLFTASTLDQMPKHASSALLFGRPFSVPVPDIDRTDYLLMLGANPLASNGSLCTAPDFPGRLKALQRRGGRLVVIDPRRTRTAKRADEHHFIRPGTDAFLLAALLNVLFAEGLAQPGEGLRPHLEGYEAVRGYVEGFTPERVGPECGMDPEAIRGIARALAGAKRAAVYGRMGTSTVEFGTLTSWLVDVLNIATGNLDREGGAMFTLTAHARYREDEAAGGRGYALGRWQSRVDGLPEVMGELPVAAMAGEIETPGEGQIRALITIAGNPALSAPNAARLDAALGSLDFMVSVDPYRNETTRHADVILPPPSHLYRSHYDVALYEFAIRNISNYSPAALPMPEGALAEWEILAKLALIAAGQGAGAPVGFVDELVARQYLAQETASSGSAIRGRSVDALLEALEPRRGPERLLDAMLRAGPYGDHFGERPDGLTLAKLEASPHGLDFGGLKPRLPGMLRTVSGKIEVASEVIEAELARLVERLEAASGADSMLLIGRRHLRSNNSWMHNLPGLVRGKDRCTLLLHPEDAARHGVEDGASVEVRSRVGAVVVKAELTEDIAPGVVSLPHGWGHGQPGTSCRVSAEHPGVNTNILTDDGLLDRVSGTAALNGVPVTLAAMSA